MRIKPAVSFPYPVLSVLTADYGERDFKITLDAVENPAIGHVELRGSLSLDDEDVRHLIEAGDARVGLMITCQATYLDLFVPCGLGSISHTLGEGEVRGPVNVRGVVVSLRDGVVLRSPSIVDDFPPDSKCLRQGSFIALTEEVRFEAGLEKLAPLESIFRLKRSESTPIGQAELGLDTEAIEVRASPELYDVLYNLREQAAIRDVLIPSLFLPVVMAVLEEMRCGNFEERRWWSVMSARCASEGINVRTDDPFRSAQKLLSEPLMLLKAVVEGIS